MAQACEVFGNLGGFENLTGVALREIERLHESRSFFRMGIYIVYKSGTVLEIVALRVTRR